MKSNTPGEGRTSGADDGGFGTVGFNEWLTTTASELTQNLAGRHHYETAVPGSESEAAAYLTSQAGLAPDQNGLPTLAEEGGLSRADEFVMLATIVYSAAFPKARRMSPDLHVYTSFESDLVVDSEAAREEWRAVERISVACVLVKRFVGSESEDGSPAEGGPESAPQSILVCHESALPVSNMACRSLQDLRRLYQKILSAKVPS